MAWRACAPRCSPRCVRAPARQARTRADLLASPSFVPPRSRTRPGQRLHRGHPRDPQPRPQVALTLAAPVSGRVRAGPARTGSARGARREEKALGAISSLIGRAAPNGRGLSGAAPCDWLSGGGEGAVLYVAPPPLGAPGRGYSARAARRGRVRRWRRARRERAWSWRCSSCARWPPAPRGQVRTGLGRAGLAPGWGGIHSGGPGWRGAPGGVGPRGVPRGLRGALAGSRPRGWAPGRLRERRAWGEERRRGRLRRGTSAAGGAGGTEAPWGYPGMAGPGWARRSRRAVPEIERRMRRVPGDLLNRSGYRDRAGLFSP